MSDDLYLDPAFEDADPDALWESVRRVLNNVRALHPLQRVVLHDALASCATAHLNSGQHELAALWDSLSALVDELHQLQGELDG